MRRLAWPVILYQLLWLNVIVPGHVRGRIAAPGSCATSSSPACCASEAARRPDKRHPTTPDGRRRCAVCFVALGHSLPPVYRVDLQPTDSARIAPSQVAHLLALPAPLRTYDANGPPAPLR